MRYSVCLCAVWLLGFCAAVCPAYAGDGDHLLPVAGTQWKGRKVAFMGDSITDKAHVGTTKNYWQYLQEMLGLVPFVYGINGQQWRDVPGQCEKLRAERGGDIDAILIFAGTNDFNSGTPLGEWYTTGEVPVEVSGPRSEIRTRRTLSMDGDTFRGRINIAMSYLKANFPDKQVILLTPIHRGYARFGDNNILSQQPRPLCGCLCGCGQGGCERLGRPRHRPEQHLRALSQCGFPCPLFPRRAERPSPSQCRGALPDGEGAGIPVVVLSCKFRIVPCPVKPKHASA